jgi:hypothetical protein
MENEQLIKRIEALEKEINNLKNSSSIPYETEKAFGARGFLTKDNFMVVGQTYTSAGGTFLLEIEGLNKYSMAFAAYANFPDVSATGLDAYIEVGASGRYQLHIEGTASKLINYVIFLNNFIKVNQAT